MSFDPTVAISLFILHLFISIPHPHMYICRTPSTIYHLAAFLHLINIESSNGHRSTESSIHMTTT